MSVASSAGLGPDQVAAYRRDGYIVPDFRMPDDLLRRMRGSLDRLLADNPGLAPEHIPNAHIDGVGPEGIRGSADFLDYARMPAFLDLVEQVLGPDIILWGVAVFCKPAGTGRAVPWHQDGHYWPIRPLANCTLWVALDDSLPDNGCLRVIAGSHRRGPLRHATSSRADIVLDQALDPDEYDEAEARDVALRAGQVSLHDVDLVHGSNANRSGRRRAGVTFRYMPGTSVFDRTVPPLPGAQGLSAPDFAARPIFLMRGEDRTGQNDFAIGRAGA